MTTLGRLLFTLDLALVLVSWPLVLWIGYGDLAALSAPGADLRAYVYPATNALLLFAMGMYRRDAILETRRSLGRVPLVVGFGVALSVLLCGIPSLVLESVPFFPGRDQALVFALACVTFTVYAFVARVCIALLLHQKVLRRRLLVVGAGRRAWDLLHMITREGSSFDYDIAFLHDPGLGAVDPRLSRIHADQVVAIGETHLATVVAEFNPDQIVVAPDERRGMDLNALLACKRAGYPVLQYLTFIEKEIRRVDLKRMELGWLVFSEGFTFGVIDRFLKRLFDLTVSFVVLLLASPLLLAGMLAIRWEAPGPVFYRQERVTQDGLVFRILKLRTMRVDAEAQGAVWAAAKDNRITRVGAFLRRTRIDELPQLLNILKGEMSFVGPRPERPVFVAELAAQIPLYNERHMVKAGLTGWAQINYPYGASIDDARSKLSYDLYYVKNFSILFDFVILLQTLRVVLWPSGVR